MSVSIREVTPEAPGTVVLRLAGHVARKFHEWGALERADYVSAACLAFYDAVARWTDAHYAGYFGHYALRYMYGAVRELRRVEARHQKGWIRKASPSSKDVHTLSRRGNRTPFGSSEGGSSVSPEAQTRRRASQREHNRTYYQRHVGLQACEDCGDLAERGHGARRCTSCARTHRLIVNRARCRAWRAQRRQRKLEAA